jgi:hypothetical protein
MKIGDLVRNLRAGIGVPRETVGLIINKGQSITFAGDYIYEIHWIGCRRSHSCRLAQDLELI